MGDRITQPFEPYDPEPSGYDWDYAEDEDHGPPRILWGRVAILGTALLLAFLLGRATAPEGVSQEEFDAVRRARAELEAQVEQLRAQPVATPTPEPTPAAEDTPDEDARAEVEGETYVVKSGDTLRGIAEQFYGDPTLDDLIADANDITDPTQLRVGQELIIPPKPE